MPRFKILHLLATLGFLAAAGHLLIRPLLRERSGRGDYFWGHYHPIEVYVGIPLGLLAVALAALYLVPAARRAVIGVRVLGVLVSVLLAVLAFDVLYTFGVLGIGKSSYWMDLAHVSRLDNEADEQLGFRRKPNRAWKGRVMGVGRVVEYQADANGFRNPEEVESADIVFIGDSYTEAAQVNLEDTFVRRVGRVLGQSVVNLGRGAYGPTRERIVLERYGFGYEPKRVVWQIFDGNDLVDATEFATWQSNPSASSGVGLLDRHLANSFFHGFLAETYIPRNNNFATLSLADGSTLQLRPRYRWQPNQAVARGAGFRAVQTAVREGAELCRDRGIELLIVFIPSMIRVHAPRLTFEDSEVKARFLPNDPPKLNDFGTKLGEYCEQLGVSMVDMMPAFRAAIEVDPEGIYIPQDEHLDVKGHQLVAEAIVGWVRS